MAYEDISRRDGESNFEYHSRLVNGKLTDKTLADVDYTELAEALYGKTFSSDVARRMIYGSKRTLDAILSDGVNSISDEKISADIDDKIIELKKERQRMFDQRRELNKVITQDARYEYLEQVVKSAARDVEKNIGLVFKDIGDKFEDSDSDNEAILVFSDWHYGMITENIYNVYNTDICKYRVRMVVTNVIEKIKLHGCSKLHVALLGDFIHGAINVSARVASEELVVDQLIGVSEIIAQAIIQLAAYVPELVVYATYGNHGRVTANKKESVHKDNLEKIISWWLKERLASYDHVFVLDQGATEFIVMNANGHNVCAVHGDLDNVKSSPTLLSTLLRKQLGIEIDCVILGDKHHRESFEELGVTSMICGALCGADDYANSKRLFSTPSQLLLFINRNGLDAEYRISCV